MDRRDLLKRILGGSALFAMQRLPTVRRTVPIHTSAVRGFPYHQGPQVQHRLRVGDPLRLVREPENEFDERAVAVHWNGEKLGYLPREENATLAVMLDQGLALQAHISALHPEAPMWMRCEVTVELPAPLLGA